MSTGLPLPPEVDAEMDRVAALKHSGFITEAAVRIGRAIEAALYSVAVELGKPVRRVAIPELRKVRDQLDNAESNQMRRADQVAAVELAEAAKLLNQATAVLAANEQSRLGRATDTPRSIDGILRELIGEVGEPALKQKLVSVKERLRDVMDLRNRGAHACMDGGAREVELTELEEAEVFVRDSLEHLAACLLQVRVVRARAKATNDGEELGKSV